MSSNTQLWRVAGVLLASGFMLKQYAWSVISEQVSEVRKIEHKKATKSLEEARESSKQYSLPKLTKTELDALSSSSDKKD
jgi:hypothetical protein